MMKIKTAIITGASKGIGKACAIGLAQMGYRCILLARTKTLLQEVCHEINTNGGSAHFYDLDLTIDQDVQSCINDILMESSTIDVLVNNAGLYLPGSLDISTDEFRHLLDINLLSNYTLLKELVPTMKKQQSGYIFNISSRAGKIGFSGSGTYSASKFALTGLNESLYRALVPEGIRVTAICPGWVDTDMAQIAGSPLKGSEMIQPEDVFKTIYFLLQLSNGACIKELVMETPQSIS
jgi:short-subunit dehydrogenase